MEFLPTEPADVRNGVVPYGREALLIEGERPNYTSRQGVDADAGVGGLNIGELARKYWLLLLTLLILGAAVGFVTVVLSTPQYKARMLLEVMGSSGLKNSPFESGALDNEVNIQTQINILRSGTFLRRGIERLQSDSVPLAPTGMDIFSRLRQRVHPATQNPIENVRRGLEVALATFDARPVNRTRLIELSCESSSPDVAAQFLNSMAAEFVEDTSRSRMQTSQRTTEWLQGQIEDTKSKLNDSEEHLRNFVAASGNVFAGQDVTLEDTKLTQLKGELARINAERIARQTRYELTLKNAPESLSEVLNDGVLRGYEQQINSLKRERAQLETTYTAKNQKIRQIDAQLPLLEKSYQGELKSVVDRIKNDYDASLRQERLLSSAYASQSSRVGSQASKAAQYNSLKREVDMLRQMYQNLLMQSNEAALTSSVPINPIRTVEAATPPEAPYKPQPVLNISFGGLMGMVLAGGIVFLRERMDRSIKAPGFSRSLFNSPELGVIPNLGPNGNSSWGALSRAKGVKLELSPENPAAALANWQSGPSFITESFRGTLTSILRNQAAGQAHKTVLITSPGPAEGKTTVIQNLGIALAETGRRVLLVDADFRRPHLHRKFGLPNERGLVDLLSEDLPLSEYPPEHFGVSTSFPGLSVLPNGSAQINVSKALYSPRLRKIFETLISRYDMVMVDAPPILHVADTRIIAPLTDALILVLRCGVTERATALEAYQRIQEDGLTLIGTVLTDYSPSSDKKRQYYYDYGNS